MNRIKKKILFDTPLLLFALNSLFFIRKSLVTEIRSNVRYIHGNVLDVGCGSKPYQELFVCDDYIGIDVEVSGHIHSESKIDVFFDGSRIPFPDSEFDCVVSFEVFEHVADLDLLVSEIRRVLKPEGKILVTVPFLWGEHEVPYDYRRLSIYGAKGLLENAGFEIINAERYGRGFGSLYQICVDSLLNKLKFGFLKRVAYAVVFSWVGLFFYALSRMNKRQQCALYSGVLIVARKQA